MSRECRRRLHSAEPATETSTDSAAAVATAAGVERSPPAAWTATTRASGSPATAEVARTTEGQYERAGLDPRVRRARGIRMPIGIAWPAAPSGATTLRRRSSAAGRYSPEELHSGGS